MMKLQKAKGMVMIIRGERSKFHKAPFHPIIIVTRKHTYQYEVGHSNEGATAVEISIDGPHFNLLRYKGYIVDAIGHYNLFDGVYTKDFLESIYLKECLAKAVWWSDQKPPHWLEPNFAEDSFTKDKIETDSGMYLLTESEQERLLRVKEKYDLAPWLK